MDATYLSKLARVNNTAHCSPKDTVSRCMKTLIEMLRDRGYVDIQTCQTVEEAFESMTALRPLMQAVGNDRLVRVHFHNEERVGVKQLRAWTENAGNDAIIVVSLDGPTSFTRKEAEEKNPNVSFFLFRDLCVNITRHELVPRHERIPRSTLPLDGSSVDALPVLYTTDRVAQYYDFRPDDIVRITRTAGVQEPVYYYRILRVPPAA